MRFRLILLSLLFLLVTSAAHAAVDANLIASYVDQPFSQQRVEFVSTSNDPPLLFFFFDEHQGSFEHRPGGACETGSENPTYFKLRYKGDYVESCAIQASWDANAQPCSAGLLQKINAGEEFVLNTDYFLMDPATCEMVQPLTNHVQPPLDEHWFRVTLDLGKQSVQRSVRFRRLYPTSWAEAANVRLQASYVTGPGLELVRVWESYTTDDPPAFSFYFQEAFGSFHQRDPDGVCSPLLQNPTYLWVRYIGPTIDACTYQASWDNASHGCSADLIWKLNHGWPIILNTDAYDRELPSCQVVQPLSPHLLSGVPGWMHLSIWADGEVFERRINFVKQ